MPFGDHDPDEPRGEAFPHQPEPSPWLRHAESVNLRVDPPSFTGSSDLAADSVPAMEYYSTPIDPPRIVALTFFDRRITIVHLLIALLFGVLSCASVVATYRGIGHAWDEALYYKPAEQAISWWAKVWNAPDLLHAEAIDRYWGERLDSTDPLHPEIAPIPKLILGAGAKYIGPKVRDPLLGMRIPIAVAFGLTVATAYLFGALEFGALGGCAAALFYWLTPRAFGHAHIAASETLLTLFSSLTCLLFVLSTRRGWLAPFVGIVFGLALATKITSLILPLPLLLWGQVYRRREYASSMFCLLLIGPLTAVAVWPWLWHDSLPRFFSYILFYLEHQSTAVYYLGKLWGYTHGPAAPWHYPWVITAVGNPEWLLLFAAIGLLAALLHLRSRPVLLLVFVLAFLWIGISSLPNAPKYDGERLFFPSLFFLALLAAAGFTSLFAALDRQRSSARGPVACVVLLIITIFGAFDMFMSHPNELNYFDWVIGRPSGAADRGLETSYWGEALNEDVISYLNDTIQPGQRVQVLAMNELCFEDLQQWGKLRTDCAFGANEPPINWIILQVRQGFLGSYERAIRSGLRPAKVFSTQHVPKIEIYAAPTDAQSTSTVQSAADTSTTTATADWRLPESTTTSTATGALK